MAITHNLGFPRIGKKRELKFALEKYWKRESTQEQLLSTGLLLRQKHWSDQLALNFVPVGDFSFYDQVLDTSFMLGNIPQRAQNVSTNPLDDYFRVARGRASVNEPESSCIHAGEMTKWFDTNYHYIVPEFTKDTEFTLNASRLLEQVKEAKVQGLNVKPVIIGPVSYLWLGKSKDDSNKLDFLDKLIPAYAELMTELEKEQVEWIQIDEPILVLELENDWKNALKKAYQGIRPANKQNTVKILLTTYFGKLKENLELACELAVDGIHLDAINAADEIPKLVELLPDHKVISLGVVNGRNIWKTDLNKTLSWLKPLHETLKERLWLAPSCSLLHVPVDLVSEEKLDTEVKSWLSFAIQKLTEIDILARALNEGEDVVADELIQNLNALKSRKESERVHDSEVAKRVAKIDDKMQNRSSSFVQRSEIQQQRFDLPLYPTTTIGSFPQTVEIRQTRRDHKAGTLSDAHYKTAMQDEIKRCIREQETLDLDVLVHGEAERNDMVEYFGEQLTGYAFSQFAWVQSYGSRCVKPPIIYGDISRPTAMTVEWSQYAQSLTEKPMKGMLTGPVTILNWSFVRDDQPRADTCLQLALAIRDEVLDLEASGISMIQIDEAALREGLPLRTSEWQSYLDWAIKAFRITANGVRDETQIHTHMCYSEFNDIIKSIADMDADVITIETSRSDMELLDVFDQFQYPNEIGPGVYDIHSPNIPTVKSMISLMQKATQRIPAERLWVNPDCGLKTRNWEEVKPALKNMVEASKQLNKQLSKQTSKQLNKSAA